VAIKRGKRRELTEWSKRLLGVVLLVFFGLGVLVGARMSVQWAPEWLGGEAQRIFDIVGGLAGRRIDQRPGLFASTSIALVRRGTHFYVLGADGSLWGPTSPGKEGDLPILSGAMVESASGPELLDYAALSVRAEAALSQTVSELRAAPDGTVRVYLAASPTEVIVDSSKAADELERAAWVMRRWRGHEKLIAQLDVTVADAAVVHFHAQGLPTPASGSHTGASVAEMPQRRPTPAMGRAAR
jgi:hypothetical protein